MKVFGIAGDVTVTIFRGRLGLSTRNHPKGIDLRDTYVNHYCVRSALPECENAVFDIAVGSKIRLRDLPARLKTLEVFIFEQEFSTWQLILWKKTGWVFIWRGWKVSAFFEGIKTRMGVKGVFYSH